MPDDGFLRRCPCYLWDELSIVLPKDYKPHIILSSVLLSIICPAHNTGPSTQQVLNRCLLKNSVPACHLFLGNEPSLDCSQCKTILKGLVSSRTGPHSHKHPVFSGGWQEAPGIMCRNPLAQGNLLPRSAPQPLDWPPWGH